MMNKCLYLQLFAEQKHPSPDKINMKITTKEYFDREKENSQNNLVGKMPNKVKIIRDVDLIMN